MTHRHTNSRRPVAGRYTGILGAVVLATAFYVGLFGLQNDVAANNADADDPLRTPNALSEAAAVANVPASTLSLADISHYKAIFSLQAKGEWAAADQHIRQLGDPILLGHVLAQRYLHPTAYRSRYNELRLWLQDYNDHPQAARIYRLAKRRMPENAKPLLSPNTPQSQMGFADVPPDRFRHAPKQKRTTAIKRAIRKLHRAINGHIENGGPTAALRLLHNSAAARHLDVVELGLLRSKIATSYMHAGKLQKAWDIVEEMSVADRRQVPQAAWISGLVAWIHADYAKARRYFAILAVSPSASSWDRAAGAFWSARAQIADRVPQGVRAFLTYAAQFSHTFYGQMARRWLGMEPELSDALPPFTGDEAEKLAAMPAVQRSVALVAVEQFALADEEIRLVYLSSSRQAGPALLTLSHALGIPATQLRLARGVRDADGGYFHRALFPLPPWQPREGFVVDPALIYAFMRKESRFEPDAKSAVGARGLMQLMPTTAHSMLEENSARPDAHALFEPQFNMYLGQKYLDYLLQHPAVEQNLIYLAASYNAGPGNLRKWRNRYQQYGLGPNDPLLFIETMPGKETRDFTEKVLAFYWIYRQRLGMGVPSLDQLIQGEWPAYAPPDQAKLKYADGIRF